MMKPVSPAPSSFLRRRAMLTDSVFSSTKLSVCHKASMSFSRLTIVPLSCRSVQRMRYSFLLSGSFSPSTSSDWSPVCKIAPRCESTGLAAAKSYVRRRSACTLAVSTSRSKGLAMKSSAPMFMAITTFRLSAAEDRNMIGTLERRRSSLHQ